jgi:molybdate transport system substrate-binding protein
MSVTESSMAPLRGLSSMATRLVLAELAPAFTRATGTAAVFESAGGVDAARRVTAGEAFDVVILAAEAIDTLVAGGHARAGSRVDLARSGVAVAVRAGAPHPDLSDEAAVRAAVRSARSLAVPTGPSGVALMALFERWGLASSFAGRLVTPPPGTPVGSLVASGEVELGFQQLSELIPLKGIDIVGPLPDAIQVVTTFAGAVCTATIQPEAARELLAWLAGPDIAAAKRRHGMTPA